MLKTYKVVKNFEAWVIIDEIDCWPLLTVERSTTKFGFESPRKSVFGLELVGACILLLVWFL